MEFNEKYEALEQKFREQVEKDNAAGAKSIYLPNHRPQDRVDFVLIAMEPSLGLWGPSPEEAQKALDRGFKNFAWSTEDFILHHCIKKYLCKDKGSYYITDLSKGAMLTKDAKEKPQERWQRWYPLLKQELKVVGPNAPRISIGNETSLFLSKNWLDKHAGTIYHYSAQAAGRRGEEIEGHKEAYKCFKSKVKLEDVKQTAEKVMREGEMDKLIDEILGKLGKPDGQSKDRKLSCSSKKLMFDYKVKFERFRQKHG